MQPNISPFTGQDVNNNNKRKRVSFDCVFSALPVNQGKKTKLEYKELRNRVRGGIENVRYKGTPWQGNRAQRNFKYGLSIIQRLSLLIFRLLSRRVNTRTIWNTPTE